MKNKPIKKNQRSATGKLQGRELEVSITSLTNTGDGLGHVDEQVIFVPYTMPGDEVRLKVVQDKGTFLIAELIEVLSPSADRVAPSCEFFGVCGGCDWLHIPYKFQLDVKVEQLRETLTRIGGLAEVDVHNIIASPEPMNYRNRIQGSLRDGAFHYMRRGSNKSIAVDQCQIADDLINQRLTQGFEATAKGRVEIAVTDAEVTVVPVNAKHLTGLGFRQVNNQVAEVLTSLVLDAVSGSDCSTVNDLYCGRGEWTNAIARLLPAATVIGIDSMADNIDLARARAMKDNLQNVEYRQARVEDALDKFKVKNSFCIVDPPRAGLDVSVCKALCKRPAKELLYVSCHAATLARDLKILAAGGYRVTSVQPLDMFPQTSHLECVVRLQAAR